MDKNEKLAKDVEKVKELINICVLYGLLPKPIVTGFE
jgi:hypothetical protein